MVRKSKTTLHLQALSKKSSALQLDALQMALQQQNLNGLAEWEYARDIKRDEDTDRDNKMGRKRTKSKVTLSFQLKYNSCFVCLRAPHSNTTWARIRIRLFAWFSTFLLFPLSFFSFYFHTRTDTFSSFLFLPFSFNRIK